MILAARIEWLFLSIQAQDFIEERRHGARRSRDVAIPEHSSSGLH